MILNILAKFMLFKIHTINNRNQGQLSMTPYPLFPIPNVIHALVKDDPNSPVDFTDMMLRLAPVKTRTERESYHLSFSTKLYIEEAYCQYKKFDRYNINNVQIEHRSKDIFRFKVEVSYQFFLFNY